MDIEDKILTAALELFVAEGYSATTVEKIARHAEVSKGLVYYYYKNKKAILKKVIDIIELHEEKIDFSEFDKMSIEEIFYFYIKTHYQYFYTLQTICQQPWLKIQRFFIEALSELPEFYSSVKEKYEMVLDYITKRLVKEKKLTKKQAQHEAVIMFTVFEGFIYYKMFYDEVELKDLLEITHTFFKSYNFFEKNKA